MASIVKRNNRYCVVYTYKHTNGTLKQKWETFTDLADAKNRKKEVEYKESVGTFVAPQCRTLKDLLKEYVTLYGRTKWALSTYQSNTALISNYIEPLIGSMKLQDLTTRVIEGYYQRLLKYEAVDPMCGKRKHQFVSPSTVRSVHKILRSAFEQAVKWELMEKNPCIYATLPKYTSKKRDIWTAETLFRALKVCDDPKLRLCINLSFSCSLRLGELLGLTWDCVDISPESIEAGRASIYINKELQRVDVASLNALENKNVITRFPSLSSRCTTVQVLKSPKTDSSIRTIFLPIPVDRKSSSSLTDQLADRFEKNDRLAIAITPEATRKPNPDWKLGFYYTALKAQVPIVLAYIDYKDKQIGLTQSIIPSGNVEKEMTEIKNFYRNRQGKHPENFAI